MTDIESILDKGVTRLINDFTELIREDGFDPTPDKLAELIFMTRKTAISDNIGPIAEGLVQIADRALDLVLPRCSQTREQIEEIINNL